MEDVEEPAQLREPDIPVPHERTVEPQNVRQALTAFFTEPD